MADPIRIAIGAGQILLGLAALRKGFTGGSDLSASKLIETNKRGGLVARRYSVRTMDDRIKHIIASIQKGKRDPLIREFAVKAVSQKCGKNWCIAEKDYWGEVQEVFNSVRGAVRYVHDIHNVDTFQAARRTVDFHGGDCDDYVITLGSLLQSIGYPIILRIIQPKTERDFSHILLLAGLPPTDPTQWVALDASTNQPAGWHPPAGSIARVKDYPVE